MQRGADRRASFLRRAILIPPIYSGYTNIAVAISVRYAEQRAARRDGVSVPHSGCIVRKSDSWATPTRRRRSSRIPAHSYRADKCAENAPVRSRIPWKIPVQKDRPATSAHAYSFLCVCVFLFFFYSGGPSSRSECVAPTENPYSRRAATVRNVSFLLNNFICLII